MDCYNCGHSNPSGTRKCHKCSAPLRDFSKSSASSLKDTDEQKDFFRKKISESFDLGADQPVSSIPAEKGVGFWFILTGSLFGVAGFLSGGLPGAMVPQAFSGLLSLGCWAAALYCFYRWGQEISKNLPSDDQDQDQDF